MSGEMGVIPSEENDFLDGAAGYRPDDFIQINKDGEIHFMITE